MTSNLTLEVKNSGTTQLASALRRQTVTALMVSKNQSKNARAAIKRFEAKTGVPVVLVLAAIIGIASAFIFPNTCLLGL